MSSGALRPVAVRGERVVDPAGWSARDLAGNDDWIVRLDDRDIAGLREMAANFRRRHGDDANSLLHTDRSDFDLGSFHGKLKAIAHALKDGKGLVLLRGLPVQRLESIDTAIIYWAIGLHLGVPASNNPDGDMIGHVTDLGKDRHHPKHRGYQTRATMDYHNDQANVVGLLCVQTAKRGGESKVVSSVSVYNELIRRRPDLLGTLCGDFCWSMMGEVDEDESPYYTSPVFNFLEGFLCTSFGPDHMRKGHVLLEAPDMTPWQSESIRVVEEICEDLHYPMELATGDIQFLNNMVALHTRKRLRGLARAGKEAAALAALADRPGHSAVDPVHATLAHRLVAQAYGAKDQSRARLTAKTAKAVEARLRPAAAARVELDDRQHQPRRGNRDAHPD